MNKLTALYGLLLERLYKLSCDEVGVIQLVHEIGYGVREENVDEKTFMRENINDCQLTIKNLKIAGKLSEDIYIEEITAMFDVRDSRVSMHHIYSSGEEDIFPGDTPETLGKRLEEIKTQLEQALQMTHDINKIYASG